MDIRKGRGVWWSLALTQGNTRAMPRELCRNVLIMCRKKRPQMEPKASHWYTNNEINVSVKHPRNCFTSFVRVRDQSPVCLYVYAHFSVCSYVQIDAETAQLTSCSSMCVGHAGHGCCVCLPARPGSQTCIWWPVAGRCLDGPCWRWSQTGHPQTSVTYPTEEGEERWNTD